MQLEPTAWNVVIAGDWNPAILTPNGIVRYVYGLEAETVVDLEVALDRPSVTRVKYGGFSISASSSRLIIDSDVPQFDILHQAAQFGVKGMESLPVTPIRAAGINVRYNVTEAPQVLVDRLSLSLDDALLDAEFEVSARRLQRTLSFEQGSINLSIQMVDAEPMRVELNFEKRSAVRAEIEEWLRMPSEALKCATNRVLTDVLGIAEEEIASAQTD